MVRDPIAVLNTAGRLAGLLGATDADFATSQLLAQDAGDALAGLERVRERAVALGALEAAGGVVRGEEKARALALWQRACDGHLVCFERLVAGDRATAGGDTVGELALFSLLHFVRAARPGVAHYCPPGGEEGRAAALPPGLAALYDRIAALPAARYAVEQHTATEGECGMSFSPSTTDEC